MEKSEETIPQFCFISEILEICFQEFYILPIGSYWYKCRYQGDDMESVVNRRIAQHYNGRWFIVTETITHRNHPMWNTETFYLFEKWVNINLPDMETNPFLIIRYQFTPTIIDAPPPLQFIKGRGVWIPESEKIVLDYAGRKYPSINLSRLTSKEWNSLLITIKEGSQYDEKYRLNVCEVLHYIWRCFIHTQNPSRGCWEHELRPTQD